MPGDLVLSGIRHVNWLIIFEEPDTKTGYTRGV